ncbi:MAG: hypothetical protein RIS90_1177 [Pseudomonadota bacterium]
MSLLEINGLVIEAGGRSIVDDVSLTVAPGEVLALIGESGAGKSTIGHAVLGYVNPGCQVRAGTVRFDGVDVYGLNPESLRHLRQTAMAYVAQSAAAAFNPATRLADQVLEVARLTGRVAGADLALARDLFERLGLPDPVEFCQRYPHQVSGGQMQRAMVAMALANAPKLIVFDEPTTALDVTTQIEVLRVIRDAIRGRELAAVYISHDLAVVAQLADRIMVLRHGRMVEEGPTQSMVATPGTPYVQALVGLRKTAESIEVVQTSQPVLEVDGVTLGYGRGPSVVRDVSLRLDQGQVLAVVGQSGSGKSSLARAVVGLLPPRSGTIRLQGSALLGLEARSKDERRRIQLIHQSPDVALNPRQSVRETIGRPIQFFFGCNAAEVERRVRALLEATELDADLLDRMPDSLSGGQKQRVCIARALGAEPKLLVCDEITSALDLLVEDSIILLLRKLLTERGLAILFITHNLWLARRFAHEVAVMSDGVLVEHRTTRQVFDHPQHAYTRALLSAVPSLEAGWLDRHLADP